MPLLSTRILIVAGLVVGTVVLAIAVVAPELRPEGGDDAPTLGSRSRISTGPAPPDPVPYRPLPVPERPAAPPPLPTSAAEVIRTFPRALAAVRARVGPRAQLTGVNVNEISVLFSHRLGRTDRAGVLRWRPERSMLEPADPRFAGTGSPAEEAFPIGAVRSSVPGRLIRRVRWLAPRGNVVHTVHLFRLPVTHALIWQVSVEAGGRNLTYRAAPDGSRLRELR